MIIKNGYIIDPANKRVGVFDIRIKDGKIAEISEKIDEAKEKIIDAKDKIVTPGLIDMHVHLREPGREDMETVKSGTRSAISGGMTGVCAMPNTEPAIDNVQIVKRLDAIIKNEAKTNVFITGAITKGRRGQELVDIEKMKKIGVVALSDDGNSVQDEALMLKALKEAKANDMLIISHCEDKTLSKSGVINQGLMATKLGLRGIPKKAEYEFVKRDIELAKKAKAKIHIAHVSCKESVDIIRKAKKEGVAATAETAPHYFSLEDTACETYDTRTKMNPPLRSADDVDAIKQGLGDGTIDAIASDHAPHGKHDKEVEFDIAAFGIIGLETSLGLAALNLVEAGIISWGKLVELMSLNPAKILGLKGKGALSVGCDGDITIIDPKKRWVYKREDIESKSSNSPFINKALIASVTDVIVGGKVAMKERKIED